MNLEKQITCVRRELGKRQALYPKMVEAGKLTQDKANEEIELMQAVLATLTELQEHGPKERSSARKAPREEPANMEQARKQLVELLDAIEALKLSSWEEEFLQSLHERVEKYGADNTLLTDKQVESLARIHKKHL